MTVPSYPGFEGVVGRTREESTAWWAPVPRARAGSPNIVVLFMDDMGFSDVGCYGSEIATPHIDALAARGLRLNHYTSHPMCSPARAALLTGRNAHAVGTGWLANTHAGFPGYTGDMPMDAPTLPETLRAGGYATVGVGKWHNSVNGVTPNETWPTGRGFERFYGFLEGETNYFSPARLLNNNMVIPMDAYPPGYYATDDFADKAIGFIKDIRNAAPAQPFFLYLAPNAMHGPLQAKDEDLAKYRGQYDLGWDELRRRRLDKQKALGLVPADTRLAPRDPRVPAWDDVPAAERALYVRHMETYAAMLDCVDQNVGRLVALLKDLGELDNTIFIVSADNGGTHAAGAHGTIHFNRRYAGLKLHALEHNLQRTDWIGSARCNPLYPIGWAQASNTPFPTYKTQTGGGGRRVMCLVSWPAELKARGQVCTEFAHVTDLMPTLLDMAGVAPLATSHGKPSVPMHGRSLKPMLLEGAPSPRHEQYYECWSNRGYYRDGWVAVSVQVVGEGIDFDNWTLHRQATDFSESVDLRSQYPDQLAELVEAFDRAAWANGVYPLDNRNVVQKFQQIPPSRRPLAQSRRRFLPGSQTVHKDTVVPLVADRNFTVTVDIEHAATDEGVLFALGDVSGGLVMYVEDARLHVFYNAFGDFTRMTPVAMPAGAQAAGLEFQALGRRQGRGRLWVDGQPAGDWQDLSPTLMGGFHEGMDIGIDRRGPVEWELYERRGNFRYSGVVRQLVLDSQDFAPDSAYAQG